MKTNKKTNWWSFTTVKLLAIQLCCIAAIALAMTACKEPETETYTKDVEVTFPAYTSGNTSIYFTPTYTPDGGWGEHFSDSDITYTVTCTELSKTYNSGTGFEVTAASGPYTGPNTYTFTQTFKIGTTVVGSQVIKVDVSPANNFSTLRDAEGIILSPQAIPSVSLHLTKTVTK